jgi:hypothetical protein
VRIGVVAVSVLFLSACTLSSQNEASVDPVAAVPARSLQQELEVMVVPVQDIGGLPRGFRATPSSGWQRNALEARNSLDPQDTARSLSRAGRISGYELIYEDPSKPALRTGHGVLTVLTWAELFRSPETASSALKARRAFSLSLNGKRLGRGVVFRRVGGFRTHVGDEAYGLRQDTRFGADRLFRTVVSFRRGRVVAGAMYIRTDPRDAVADVERLAGTLDARVRQALNGSLSDEPVLVSKDGVPLDGQEPAPSAPPGTQDLARIALLPADLPQATGSDGGRYTRTTPPRISFQRTYVFQGGASMGGSRVIQIVSGVNSFENELAAETSLSLTANMLASADGLRAFEENFAATTGERPANLQSHEVELDHGSRGFVNTFDTSAGSLADFYALAKNGRGTVSLEVTGPADGFDYHDFLPLLDKTRSRLGNLD